MVRGAHRAAHFKGWRQARRPLSWAVGRPACRRLL